MIHIANGLGFHSIMRAILRSTHHFLATFNCQLTDRVRRENGIAGSSSLRTGHRAATAHHLDQAHGGIAKLGDVGVGGAGEGYQHGSAFRRGWEF